MTAMILGGLGVFVGIGLHVLGRIAFRIWPMLAGIAVALVSCGVFLAAMARAIFG